MNDFLHKVLLGALGLLLFFSFGSVALAQTTDGLQIKPAVVEDKVNPGETRQYSVTVTNVSSIEKTLYVSVRDIKAVDNAGRPIFSQSGEVTGYELSTWVVVPVQVLQFKPQEVKTIAFSVRVPTGASPGSHFASLFFSDKPNQPNLNGSGVGFDVGAIVSLKISGDIIEDAQLREFSTGKLVYPNANVDFNVRVHNLGNVLVQPTGIIEVENMFGKKVATVSVNEQQASTFPNSDRTYPAQWVSEEFSFGRYQAIATLAYGDDVRKSIYSTTSFWVLPIIPISIALGVVVFIVLAAYLLMRAYIRKKLRQMGVTTPVSGDRMSRKYQRSSSRLLVVTMAVLLLCIVFLVALFVLFA